MTLASSSSSDAVTRMRAEDVSSCFVPTLRSTMSKVAPRAMISSRTVGSVSASMMCPSMLTCSDATTCPRSLVDETESALVDLVAVVVERQHVIRPVEPDQFFVRRRDALHDHVGVPGMNGVVVVTVHDQDRRGDAGERRSRLLGQPQHH